MRRKYDKKIVAEIGKAMMNERVKQGIKQEEIAYELGVERSTVSKFEHGHIDSLSLYIAYDNYLKGRE